MLNLSIPDSVAPLRAQVLDFIEKEIYPIENDLYEETPERRRSLTRGLMDKAKADGLWALGHPEEIGGGGLPFMDYVFVNEVIGRSPMATVALGTHSLQDSIMLHMYASDEWREKYLAPLVAGDVFPSFGMTEPDVASSDATNIRCRIERDGDEYVINGRKWWISGAGDTRCALLILMGKTDPAAARHRQQSMILVPKDAPGVTLVRPLTVFGYDHAPHGHWEITFDNVRVPAANLLLGEGRGFEIAQGRLGPGRIHHCMRCIGVAERSIEAMCARAKARVAFGKPLAEQGVVMQAIADSRMEIEQARLLTLNAAHRMDTVGNKVARAEIAMIKVVAPNMALRVIDRAIQVHGGGGVSDDFGLAPAWAHVRTLRLADGPDEVHERAVARLELAKTPA